MELEEGRGEDLRLLYVALTRAQHRAVLWWAGAQDSEHSPLARILFDRDAQGVVSPYGARRHPDDEVEAAFVGLGPLVDVVRVGRPAGGRWHQDPGEPPTLEAAVFDRTLDVGWRRVSYSGITRGLHESRSSGASPRRSSRRTSTRRPFSRRGTPLGLMTRRRAVPCISVPCPAAPSWGPWCTGSSSARDFAAPT